jgi:hypothetical protein
VPVIDASANARIIQQGASDLLQQAAMWQRQQEADRSFAADQDWRGFQRQRLEADDARQREMEAADLELDQARAGMYSAPQFLLSMGDQPQPAGPQNPLDSLGGAGMGGMGAGGADHADGPLQLPGGFRRASSGARAKYLDVLEAQALAQPLESTLQQAVTEGIYDPTTAASYLQAARTNPNAARSIVSDVVRRRQDVMTEQAEADQRMSFLESLRPRLEQLSGMNPRIASQVQMLVAGYETGQMKGSDVYRALADIEDSAAGPTDEQLGDTLQRYLGPSAQPTAGRDLVSLRRHDIPIGIGDANISGRSRDTGRRQAIETRLKVAENRFERFTKLADSSSGDARARWTARANAASHEIDKAEAELMEFDAGAAPESLEAAVPEMPTPGPVAPGAPGGANGADPIDQLIDSLPPEVLSEILRGG